MVVGGSFTREPYGLGVPNYDDRFRDLVNFTLQAMKQDGTYDVIYCRWFGRDRPFNIEIWPSEPTDVQLQSLIKTDIPLMVDDSCPAIVETDPLIDQKGAIGTPSLLTTTTLITEPLVITPTIKEPLSLPTTYTVVKGDSLSLIAGRFYDDIFLWAGIYHTNRAIVGDDPNLIEIGMVFSIPELR